MILAIDCRYIGKSGIGTYIENVLQCMLEKHKENQYLLVTDIDRPWFHKYGNVSILLTDIKPFSMRELFLFPTKEINRCDAYYTPYINIPLGIRVPIFCTIHDVIFLDVKNISSTLGRLIRWLFYKRAVNLSFSLFSVSEFSANRIRFYFHTEKKICVTYSAISAQIKTYQPNTNRIFNFKYYLFVGNIKEHKGIDILICAMNEIKKRGLNTKLVIIGEYNNFKTKDDHILKLIEESKEDIYFTGYISNARLYDIIYQSIALILPTHYEGFGLPPLESLYLGSNAIITDIPVLREVYSELPVSFFHDGDIQALADILESEPQINVNLLKTRQYIDSHYNFIVIADKIIKEINKSLCQK